jgi:hypothetical protein
VDDKKIQELAGKFCDRDGNPTTPAAEDQVVIVAGFWRDMPVGAMQTQCKVCQRLLGVDKRSQAMLEEPGRVVLILCRKCWRAFGHWREGDVEAMLRTILEAGETG